MENLCSSYFVHMLLVSRRILTPFGITIFKHCRSQSLVYLHQILFFECLSCIILNSLPPTSSVTCVVPLSSVSSRKHNCKVENSCHLVSILVNSVGMLVIL
ncbi:hypothetical protein ACQJBY_022392 [Aegilops geniculata]